MPDYEFTVVFEKDEDGRILAICPALQGCYAEGETKEEAAANIREAMQAHIEARRKHGETICQGTTKREAAGNIREAMQAHPNIREAMQAHVEAHRKHGELFGQKIATDRIVLAL